MITHRPATPAELRKLLSEPTRRLYRGNLTALPLSEVAEYELVSLSGLDDSVQLQAADLRLTAGAGATLEKIEEVAARAGLEFIGSPLLEPSATVYDLALGGVFGRMQPRGGQLAGQVTGLWTPTPEGEELQLLGVRTAKGVTGYNLARAGLLGVPSLPAVRYELRLRAARQSKQAFVRSFASAVDCERFWSIPRLGGTELLELEDEVRLAIWLCGEAKLEVAPAGFFPLEPAEWRQLKAKLRSSQKPVALSPVANPVFTELWTIARAIPARTIA